MPWNDDSWKDGYDAWKLRSPYDDCDDSEEYDAERDCDHDDYEIDILTGRAECCMCPHSWYVTSEDVSREIERQARYYDDMEREERRQWWRDKTYPVRMFVFRILERIWPRKSCSILNDDEIPF
jgi:hypothetical protein